MIDFTTRPEILGTYGVVTSTHWLGSATGMSILEKGGNAFDAAVATGFTLQIVEPHLNGPGGDLPAIFYSKEEDQVRVLCGQGPAPSAATVAYFEQLNLDAIPGSGLLPAVIPGAFCGWMQLLRDYGTLRLRDVIEQAVFYAERGYPIVPKISETISKVADLFRSEWKSSAPVYLNNGIVPEPGSLHTNKFLAETYQKILKEAEAASSDREKQIDRALEIWKQGWVCEAIDKFFSRNEVLDPSGRRHKGLLTGQDIAEWSPEYEVAEFVDYRDYRIFKCGFWSQGPVMLQQLAILKQMGLAETDPAGPEFVHLTTEAAKLAFADREAWYADPDFFDVPSETLLSDLYAAERRSLIGEEASLDIKPGAPNGRSPDISAALAATGDAGPFAELMGIGEPTVQPTGESRGDTVHFDIIDQFGNMISATPSGGWLQSSPVIPELGFCLGNRGQMFWLDDSSASVLAPGKRPRTTLSPSLAFRDGRPYMAFGTPGGDQQDQWSTIFFLHHVEHNLNLQAAIDFPSFHNEHFPSSFWPRGSSNGKLVLEGRYSEQTRMSLESRGHLVTMGGAWSEGRITAASSDGSFLKAGANPRGMQGYAVGR